MTATTTKTNDRAPVLLIDHYAWMTIQEFTRQCSKEINGFAYVTEINPSTFWVGPDDVFITEQTVTGGSADVDAEAFARATTDAMMEGRTAALKLQWHSHVHMAAYFSGTDMKTIDSYGDAGVKWLISLVTNKRGDHIARLDWFHPHRMSVPLDIQIQTAFDQELTDRVAADIENLVTIAKPPVKQTHYSRSFGGHSPAVPMGVGVFAGDADFDDFDWEERHSERSAILDMTDDEWAELQQERRASIDRAFDSEPHGDLIEPDEDDFDDDQDSLVVASDVANADSEHFDDKGRRIKVVGNDDQQVLNGSSAA